ncbi:MAG: hypothetical protein II013_03405 [Lachnobacterium sp.]|nr:hypothetical protein [Lachnobacterium sp.]
MTLKKAIDIYKNLVDNIIIQDSNGFEETIPSEDAEFLCEDFDANELEVATISMLPSADYCIIYLD